MNKFLLSALSIILGLSSYSNIAFADEPDDIIAYRQNIMKSLTTNSKMIKAILNKKVSHQHLPELTAQLSSVAVMLNGNFPEGSDFGETDAKEDIWENKSDFNSKIKDLEKVTKQLSIAVQEQATNKVLLERYISIGKSCKACHKKYREK